MTGKGILDKKRGPDYKEGIKWYKKSAKKGNAFAEFSLGNCFYKGRGVKQSFQEAVKWYKRSSMHGETFAIYKLGICYYEGTGVEKNFNNALYLLKKSTEHLGNQRQQDLIKELEEKGYSEKDADINIVNMIQEQ